MRLRKASSEHPKTNLGSSQVLLNEKEHPLTDPNSVLAISKKTSSNEKGGDSKRG